jgi:hypothetical protein
MCEVVAGKTGCHGNCKTCVSNSKCGLKNACTRCKPGLYKISEKFNDKIFECSETCNGEPLQHDDYFYCDGHIPHVTTFGTTKVQNGLSIVHGPITIIFIVAGLIFLIEILLYLRNKKKNISINENNQVIPERVDMPLLNFGCVEMQPLAAVKISPSEVFFLHIVF